MNLPRKNKSSRLHIPKPGSAVCKRPAFPGKMFRETLCGKMLEWTYQECAGEFGKGNFSLENYNCYSCSHSFKKLQKTYD